MIEEAFVEPGSNEDTVVRGKRVSLPLTEDGSIDWDAASEKHKKLFIQAIKADANGILQNIQEEASGAPAKESGIADATVVAAANVIFGIEAVAFTTIGARAMPILKNVHPIVAVQACMVTEEEMAPVMEPAKRILKDLLPPEVLEYQDWAVVGQHVMKLSAAKFKMLVDLGMEIERAKQAGSQTRHGSNGGVIIDAEPQP